MNERDNEVRRGLLLINTGEGKGKTTAALGTALRAAGNGMRVLVLQFIKGSWHYGELDAIARFGDQFVIRQLGRGFVNPYGQAASEGRRLIEAAWTEADEAIHSGRWDLIVLDEINYAISYKMLDAGRVAASLRSRPEALHVILTGRDADPQLIAIADTVTEMRPLKHAYDSGILAQRGIEY